MVICVFVNNKKYLIITNMDNILNNKDKNKICFCFLTYYGLERVDIWNNFFKDIDTELYKVYIHPKFSTFSIDEYKFPINIVKDTINTTGKTNISIVNATLKLLETAYNDNKELTHYIFLSQSCIPIYNFKVIYNITSSFDKSVISKKDNNKKERYFQLNHYLKKYINYQQFTKQQPNMILVSNDVSKVLKNNFTQYFSNMICPDEHYFINILLYLLNSKIIFNQIVFCNYNLDATQGIEFNYIDEKLIKNIRSIGFLFMRKVNKNSIVYSKIYDVL
jgi:hypothetical protein